MNEFNVYIDEAGDDGIQNFRNPYGPGGSSNFLIISAVIIRKNNDHLLPKAIRTITEKTKFDTINKIKDHKEHAKKINSLIKKLHFKDLNHDQKIVAVNIVSKLPIKTCLVVSCKKTIPINARKDLYQGKNTLYWYLCRYLLERATQLAKNEAKANGIAKIMFERRGGMNYDNFRDYLEKLKNKKKNSNYNWHKDNIDWNFLDINQIEAIDKTNKAGLQIADIVASSYFKALEPNLYGNTETKYADLLKSRLYMTNKIILNNGFKLVPSIQKIKDIEETKQNKILSANQWDFINSH